MTAIMRRGPALLAALVALAVTAAQDKKDDKKDPEKKPAEKKVDTKPAEKKPGKLLIKLRADARLEIDDQPMAGTGNSERSFNTPPIEAGKRYYYVVKATWEPNNYSTISRTRKVYVRAGETTEVDLRKADPKQPDDIFVRYLATPMPVVEAMLKLAGVKKDDIVFDLGCGDGRIVVTAVAKYGAKRGVGIDLDPARIRDSKKAAKAAGVSDKVELRQEDVLKVKDIDQATVVCLYLGEDLNLQLRPILRKTLKPGTRVVSHRFSMGDWKPDKTVIVRDGPRTYQLHLWTIKKEDGEDKKEPDKKGPDKKEPPKKDEEAKKEDEKKQDEKKDKKEGSVGVLTWDGGTGEFAYLDPAWLRTVTRSNWKDR